MVLINRLSAVLILTASLMLTPVSAMADTTVSAELTPVNGTGARGTVTMTARDDGSLTVAIEARGLVPGQPHAQHIHGSAEGGHFMCPSEADDADGDGVLTNEEATGEYGTIYLSLTTRGGVSARAGLALDRMPVADSEGRLTYRRTLSADLVPDALAARLSHVHVVLHGMDANDNGRYDVKGLGVSTFARDLGAPGVPEEATNPASCGVVMGAGAPVHPTGGVDTGGGTSDLEDGSGRRTVGLGLLVTAAVLLVPLLSRRALRRRRSVDA